MHTGEGPIGRRLLILIHEPVIKLWACFASQPVIIELLITIQFNQLPDTKPETEALLSLLPNLNVYPRHSCQLLNQVTSITVVEAIAIVRHSNSLE